MFSALEQNTLARILVIEKFIELNRKAISSEEASQRNMMKTYAVSACVTRLYAVLETFVETAISDYLDEIPGLQKYSDLPDGIKKEYRLGVSHLLGKIDQGRYKHLNHENIIKRYYDALTDISDYRFVTEALIRHETNFRLKEIVGAFKKIQLTGLESWIANHYEVKSLYPEDEGRNVYDQLESEWTNFVQLRNDASHSSLDNLESEDNLVRYCDVAKKLVISISQYLHKCLLLKKSEVGKATMLGGVTEVFKKSESFILLLNKGVRLKVGDTVHVLCSTNCREQSVVSIQVNGSSVKSVIADDDGYEVGLKCNELVRKKSKLYSCP